ncbi:MAG: ABC transporter substrate-binding protein [Rhodospirillales bacterium]|nr:ABC transporter substrate-binding protein [Rhodospirillales bacterium]
MAGFAWATSAMAVTELRMTWYSDGNEGEVVRDLLDRFEKQNPDIKVIVDNVAYKAILESLPVQLAAGQGPDMARVTDLGGLSKYYLDLTPHLSNPDYWRDNVGPFLQWFRVPGDTKAIHGFMTQLTLTGPFINKTLFDQAGVAIPGEGATWDDWAAASNAVAKKLDILIPMAMDRSGHRFAGPAISMGAKYFDAQGEPAIIDDGFKAMSERIIEWHNDGTMTKELWGSVSGSAYKGANEEFANAQVVFYMSGSWQIGQFSEQIGDAFDWTAIPQPCGPTGICTGMPGGAGLVALKDTKHPKEVARVMEYLASEDVLGEFSARTLFIPAHLGLSGKGVDFKTDLPLAKAALSTFLGHVPKLSQAAYDLQGYPFNRVLFNAIISRLGQTVVGELTLDDAYKRMVQDIETQMAEKKRTK